MEDTPETPAQIVSRLLSERRPRPGIGEYSCPSDQLEEAVSEIWSQVLRIDRVGRDDNIFDLGGDSLHMTQIAARIWQRFRSTISIETFFENLTVAEIAAVLRKTGAQQCNLKMPDSHEE
jgi:acyl carrier protein